MSNSNNNQINIPQAREAMDRFKMLISSGGRCQPDHGYNGHLTSREAGSVGGQMVKKMYSIRKTKFERNDRILAGHVQKVEYIACLFL